MMIICEMCGAVIEKTGARQKYCNLCRKAAKAEYNKEYNECKRDEINSRRRQNRQKSGAVGQCVELNRTKGLPPSMAEIARINEGARAAGTSYGRYVAGLLL